MLRIGFLVGRFIFWFIGMESGKEGERDRDECDSFGFFLGLG